MDGPIDGRDLRGLNTLALPGEIAELTILRRPAELEEHLRSLAPPARRRVVVAGELSNTIVGEVVGAPVVLFRDGDEVRVEERRESIDVTVAASHPLDRLVQLTCELGAPGIELLSGIPGTVGAAVVQNVAAYGQGIGEAFASARALDLGTAAATVLRPADLRFGYRSSALNTRTRDAPDTVLLEVTLRLARSSPRPIGYADLKAHHERRGRSPGDLGERRRSVLELRAAKGMVVDGPNWLPSAGSFFVGPVVGRAEAQRIARRVRGERFARSFLSWYRPDARRVRVPAALALRASGFMNGDRWGDVGLSPHHVLAVANLGAASAGAVVAVARHLAARTREALGIELRPEVRLLGDARVPDWEAYVAEHGHRPGRAEPEWALEMGRARRG